MNRVLAVILYALACGILLFAFSMISGVVKFAFSLGAFLLGMKFFATYESWKVRTALIVVSVVFYIVIMLVYTTLAYVNDWPLPDAGQQ